MRKQEDHLEEEEPVDAIAGIVGDADSRKVLARYVEQTDSPVAKCAVAFLADAHALAAVLNSMSTGTGMEGGRGGVDCRSGRATPHLPLAPRAPCIFLFLFPGTAKKQ